jgi:uncharacterized protein (TIGR03437 family)
MQSMLRSGIIFLLPVCALLGQQPVLYHRGAVNSASFAPFGLPNAPIARGSIFSVFGENLGPATPQSVTVFPLGTAFAGVSLSVTQQGVTTQAFPLSVSATQINAIMPSTVSAGLATLRLTYLSVKSNAITIQIANSAPGIFAVSSGGFGPGVVQNFVSGSSTPQNSSVVPAAPGQAIIVWGTGLGPVSFADNVPPTVGNLPVPVTLTIGGQPAPLQYSGRTPCCSGVDQIVANVPANVPLGCWVPVTINAGGVVSNTTTMAIAAPGATTCSDPANPLSTLVRTPGTQAYIDIERMNTVENVNVSPALSKTLDKLYTRFYTRPDSPYNFDPYMSLPPAGSCILHQSAGDAVLNKSFRGTLPASASLSPQPKQTYNNGAQAITFSPSQYYFSSTMAANTGAGAIAMNPLGANAALIVDPSGPNQTSLPLNLAAPLTWARPGGILTVPRNASLPLAFTPGDTSAPTAIVLYSYSADNNSAVEAECLAPPGATSFTIPADTLANFPLTYGLIDGSYANLFVGTLGLNSTASFSSGLAANGIVVTANWLAQSVVLQ